jgi:hypothetical protein
MQLNSALFYNAKLDLAPDQLIERDNRLKFSARSQASQGADIRQRDWPHYSFRLFDQSRSTVV